MGFASFRLETGTALKTWIAGDFFNICFLIFGSAALHRCVQAFSSCKRAGLLSSRGVRASPYAGSSACGAWARGREGFRSCGLGTPDQRLSSRGALAQLPHSIRDLP